MVAGAGTGKTKTLAARVAYLIESGITPQRICLLTFTRRASLEMIRRAGALLSADGPTPVFGGTFHAVANRLLRTFGSAVGLSPEFTVMDESDASDMINLVRNEQQIDRTRKRFPRSHTLLSIYSRTVNAREPLSRVLETRFPWCAEDIDDIREIFKGYTVRKRQAQVMDFDDLLLFWRALSVESAARTQVAERFDHVLVDEYQDTNLLQAEILKGLCPQGNIMAVGDDAQSIYSFRAATVRNILQFPEHFPGCRIIKLEENYRSIPPILDTSNAVMQSATERFTKELFSQRTGLQKPLLVHCEDETEQCERVCERICEHLEQGIPLMRQAVLFRTGHHSDQLEIVLSRKNIPFHKFGGLKFVEAAHVKDMVALLRILENPEDEVSWFRVLQMLDGIGPRVAAKVMATLGVAAENRDGISPLRRLAESPPDVPPPAAPAFDSLVHTLGTCSGQVPEPELAVQVERVREFYEPLFKKRYDDADIRLRDLEQLAHIAAGYRSRGAFLSDLSLDPPRATSDLAQPPFLEEDYLTLTTIHSAKGCEWEVVHVIHAADGMIPSDMAVGDDAGIEEERRLFYVALTRARDALYIYFPLRYYHRNKGLSDAHGYAQLSRFITPDVRATVDEYTSPRPDPGDAPGSSTPPVSPDDWLKKLWDA